MNTSVTEEPLTENEFPWIIAVLFFAGVLLVYHLLTKPASSQEAAKASQGLQDELKAASLARERAKHLVTGAESFVADRETMSLDDAKNAISAIADNIRPSKIANAMKSGGGDKSKVVAVKSSMDNNIYFVAADLPDREKAANKMAEVNRRTQTLLQSIEEQLDGGRRIVAEDGTDITDNMKQLVRKHYKKPMAFAEYHNPNDLTVGSNSDKGELIEMCLRSKDDPSKWNPDNSLFRVHVHELAHSADFHFRGDGEEAHGPVFRRLHKYLLGVSENLGIYDCAEYKRSGKRFCGLILSESYDCGDEKAAAGN